jgi:predicted DNA-binding transcriptional regulator YafY
MTAFLLSLKKINMQNSVSPDIDIDAGMDKEQNSLATLLRTLKLLVLLSHTTGRNINQLREHLSEKKEISVRSIQRYISTLKKAGFEIIKSDSGYYKLNSQKSTAELKRILKTREEEPFHFFKNLFDAGSDEDISKQLVKTFDSINDFERFARAINRKEDTKNILDLLEAIKNERQVILKNYHSANGKTIRDRKVEPLAFTSLYSSLWAFDTSDKKNKLFRISRFSKVAKTDSLFEFKSKHKIGDTDVFRMGGIKATHIQLKLSLRAFNLLLEEFPAAENYLEKLSTGEYLLDTKVYGLEGVGRFVMGLPGEVKIISPARLIDYVRVKVKEFFK